MSKRLLAAAAAAAAIAVAPSAWAAPVFVIHGVFPERAGIAFPRNNSFPWIVGERGTEGGWLTLSGDGFVSAEFLGKEAGFADNRFLWRGGVVFSTGPGSPLQVPNPSPAAPAVVEGPVALPGLVPAHTPLPFSFEAAGGLRGTVTNSDYDAVTNPTGNTATRPLDIAFLHFAADPASRIYVLLDDGGGRPDDDHDDMVIRLTVAPVPAPGGLALLALGLTTILAVAIRRARR